MQILNWLSVVLLAAVAVAETEAPTELKIETTFLPDVCTTKAQNGDSIKVHYTGTLFTTGAKFDSSLERGPLPLTLGRQQVIKGWEEGLQGMCVGEKRTLTIPPEKAYGSRGFGSVIPPNSVLVFTVELMNIDSPNREEL
ncbi:hypothetical protein C8J56DRAFT_885083 [Mycena floridula]|nr:hypothetical protein C8J56DRAFT_885083 [Mycena floridula]